MEIRDGDGVVNSPGIVVMQGGKDVKSPMQSVMERISNYETD